MNIPIEVEYNTLRSEIISEMENQTNLRIAMCTIAVAILSVAIESTSSSLCLAVFLVLIPFRLLIHSKQFGILKISAYIIVFFERKYTNLQWESISSNLLVDGSKRNIWRNRIAARLGYYIASILGCLATVLYFQYLDSFTWRRTIFPIVALLVTIFYDFAFDDTKIRNNYIKEFEKIST